MRFVYAFESQILMIVYSTGYIISAQVEASLEG